MNQFELFIILDKAKTVPLEKAEIQELSQTSEIQEIMNQLGLVPGPVDIGETVKSIIEDLKKHYE
ncbi:hypothetical protein [Methanobacterium sp. SMA-27]|uniref:hypothetical protein n=1 Tax=Methanobacterium sp. SMA-27 TaxID=1495336 RepID=UPI00064E8B9F|nr:hypothetical protein [Methanobacterium sp. SMA-27]